ncbi:MAG: methyltransferase domain-containing protein, partial [Acidobacteriota bacterium]
ILDLVDKQPGWLLDLGCGDGYLAHLMTTRAGSVIGLDSSDRGLLLARRALHRSRSRSLHLVCGSIFDLPLAPASLDCVILADVLEHLEEPERAMREVAQVLDTGGRLFLSTPRRQARKAQGSYHYHEYTADELDRLLKGYFHRVEVRPFQPMAVYRLYQKKVFGRKLFRVLLNCLAILGFNPLAWKGDRSKEARFVHLCAVAWK